MDTFDIPKGFKIGMIEDSIKPLTRGKLLIPYLQRINCYNSSGLFLDQMLIYARLREYYTKQDSFISNDLKSIGLDKKYIIEIGNKIMERIITRSIVERYQDAIEMIMYRILGPEYIDYIRHPERYPIFMDFHDPLAHFCRIPYK